MKRLSRILISTLLLVTLCVAPLASAQATALYYGTVIGSQARLCYGPSSTLYGTKAKLASGTRVFYTTITYGSPKKYAKAMTEYGVSGYLYTGLISRAGSVNSSRVYRCKQSLKLLSGQGTGRNKGYTARGQRVILLSKGSKWSKVKTLRGTVGWVQTKLITYGYSG